MFRPTRASPPPKSTQSTKPPPRPPSADISIVSTSTVIAPELLNLTCEDIDFIDSVVARAGALATSFPAVFKAYNTILKERSVDSGEVRYYGKLLKLGTMKGKNWGEKWEAVKRQYDVVLPPSDDDLETASLRVKSRSKYVSQPSRPVLPRLQDINASTNDSGSDDENTTGDVPQYHQSFNVLSSKRYTNTTFRSARAQDSHPKASIPSSLRPISSTHIRPATSDTSASETEHSASMTAPPSYNLVLHHQRQTVRPHPRSTEKSVKSPHAAEDDHVTVARKAVAQAKGNRRRVLNEDDVWNNIKMQQLEEEADRYREEKLLERCWQVWRQGYQWIVVTIEQIDEARNSFVLRLALHHWRNSLLSRRAMHQEVVAFDNNRRLRVAMIEWRDKLRKKQQEKWRDGMRRKMRIIKDKRELRTLKIAWMLWCRMHELQLADHHYNSRVLFLAFLRWKERLRRIEAFEAKLELFRTAGDQRILRRYWQSWQSANGLLQVEREIIKRVEARIMWNVWNAWRKRTYAYRRAAYFRDRYLQKWALFTWKDRLKKVHVLETRADKRAARQDKILVCAILRVWAAHVRGREIERRRDEKLSFQAWSAWRNQNVQIKKREELAATVHDGSSTKILLRSLSHWQRACEAHKNTRHAAIRRYDEQVCHRVWSLWLSRFREIAEERKRQKLVKKLQDRQAARILYRWLLLARQKHRCQQTETLVQERIHQRIGRDALAYWTKRVIFMRERELHAIEIYQERLERATWNRFKAVRARRKDSLTLLDDHLALKQEDTLRRLFYRWLAATRVTQHRRYILQGREDQIKFEILQNAWGKWKDHYLERRLRPLEDEMLIRTQQNLLYQAFSVWHAKAKTKPAIMAVKFCASHCKKKYYEKWKEAMPIAQQTRKAREKRDNVILSNVLNRWLQAYQSKLAFKAVARARYLRLPTMAARGETSVITSPPSLSVSPSFKSTIVLPSANRKATELFPRHTTPRETVETVRAGAKEDSVEPTSAGERSRSSRLSKSPFGSEQGIGIVSLLRTNVHRQGGSDLSPPRPKYQLPIIMSGSSGLSRSAMRDTGGVMFFSAANAESAPPVRAPRSTVSDDVGGRNLLWNRHNIRRLRANSSVATESPPSTP